MKRRNIILLVFFLVTLLSFNINAKQDYYKSILSFDSKVEEVESGKDIHYVLNFKVTGNKEAYQNYKLNIQLPKKEYINFSQNVNELMIDNQKPVYDAKNNMLRWNLKKLKSGVSYKLVLKVGTNNSIIPDGSELISKASLLNGSNKVEKEESVKTKVKSTGKLAVSNKFSKVIDSDFIVPAQEGQGIWDFIVSVPKSDFGDKYIKENTPIKVSYILEKNVEYKEMVQGSDKPTEIINNPDGTTTLRWDYTASSFKEQSKNKNDFFNKKFQVITYFNKNIAQFTNVTTVGKIETTFFDSNDITSKEENATVFVLSSEPNPVESDGELWALPAYGPLNGKGDITHEIIDPIVYDGDLLGFGTQISPTYANHPSKGPSEYETYYSVDDHLYLNSWNGGYFMYCPDSNYTCIPAKEKVQYDVYVKYGYKDNKDENYTLLLKDVVEQEIYQNINPENKHISDIKIVMQKTSANKTTIPAGLLGTAYFYFTIEPGYVGSVQNEISDVIVRDGWTRGNQRLDFGGEGYPTLRPTIPFWGPHTAKVVAPPTGVNKVVQTSTSFEDESKNVIQLKDNKLNVSITNTDASITGINSSIKTYILISQEIELEDKNIEKISNNYKNTQMQLYLINWGKGVLSPGEVLNRQFNAKLSKETPTNIFIEAYSYLGIQDFVVPKIDGEPLITDSYKIKDTYDLDGNSKDEYILKTGNKYLLDKNSILETSIKVKKSTINSYDKVANSSGDRIFDFKLEFSKLSDKKLNNLVLVNTLPNQKDIGLSDHKKRNSDFNLMLKGPIILPKEWVGKVRVTYSTVQTPKISGVIDKDTYYPNGAIYYSDAKESQEASWVDSKDVKNWNEIRSFKIETKENINWIDGSTKEIKYQLQLPKNYKINKKEVKAYNSFIVATNNLQPTEPQEAIVKLNKKKLPKTGSDSVFTSTVLIIIATLSFALLKKIEEEY